ncbi:MAG TPA: glycerol-3-phosphate dehydrogenase, partial [Anaerolineae bacterium]|nr:glycerol-3-phosphate dehydrogenase [Anaerolineae bacterium]
MTANECFDLLIVGGGINGAGIARDAAGRGLKVALVEQSDLAAGTSSASSKLIHGGLRYLEFFEFRLVRESLVERERLLRIAPHLVRPMQFILPHVPGLRPRWQIRFGLFFYDYFSGRRTLQPSRSVRVASGEYGELRTGLDHAFAYSDCWVDDSRLVVLNAIDAAQRGAVIRTRTRLVSAAVEGRLWRAQCVSQDTGTAHEVRARALVNAAGPWVAQVLRSLPVVDVEAQVRLVKGSHIVVPRLYDGAHAFMLQNPDGRIVFAIPFEHDCTLVGTTDVPFAGDPAEVHIADDEVRYLCETVNSYFRRSVSADDVRWTYAGVRPLWDDAAANASRVTRDYRIELAETAQHPPILSVFGGKLTTYRRLAETVLARLHGKIGGSTHCWTHRAPLPGGDIPQRDFDAFLRSVKQRWSFLSDDTARRLARAYGTRVEKVLGAAASAGDLGEHYGAGLSAAEVSYLIANEWAVTADDILWRRTKLGLRLSDAQR